MGFDGTPSIAVLDAEGKIVARAYWPYTVANFRRMKQRIDTWVALKKKADAGDAAAAVDAALAACGLGAASFDDLELDEDELTEAQKHAAEVQRANSDVESLRLMLARNKSDGVRATVREEVLAFYEAGTHPDRSDLLGLYWGTVGAVADERKDAAMAAAAAAGMKEAAALDPSLAEAAKRLAERAAALAKEGG